MTVRDIPRKELQNTKKVFRKDGMERDKYIKSQRQKQAGKN
jgi:hypothetical protein